MIPLTIGICIGLLIGLYMGGQACKKLTAQACEMLVSLSTTMRLPKCPHPWQAMTAGNTLVLANRDHKPLQVVLDDDALVIREIEFQDLNQKPRSAPCKQNTN